MSGAEWDTLELAATYDRISNAQFLLGRYLIDRMDVEVEDDVLDVGCGTGRLASVVSEIVGQAGRMVGLDPSPQRIQVANGKLSDHPRPNLKFVVGAAENLAAFSEATFDKVYFSLVLHWIAAKEKALAEAYRVLRPGGRIGIAAPSADSSSILKEIIMELLSRPPYAGHARRTVSATAQGSAIIRRITKAGLETLLLRAGFGDLVVETKERRKFHQSAEELVRFYEASSFGNFLRFMPDDLREDLKRDIIQELEKRRTADGIELTSQAIVAIAKKSG
ncbi:MAG: methyltransferase domain-containing protein [Methanomassiliicoccales archaeon]